MLESTKLKPAAQQTSPNIEIPFVNVKKSSNNKRKSHQVQQTVDDNDDDDDDDDSMSALTTETSHIIGAWTMASS